MPNVDGPSVAKRRLFANVTVSKLLYAAPVWANRALRLVALRVIRGYRTVSAEAILFLTEILPGDLQARKRVMRRRRRSQSSEQQPVKVEIADETWRDLLGDWQERWCAETGVAAWTKHVDQHSRLWQDG